METEFQILSCAIQVIPLSMRIRIQALEYDSQVITEQYQIATL